LTNLLLGSGGKLGQALKQILNNEKMISISRDEYIKWGKRDGLKFIIKYFKNININDGRIFIAGGILNPSEDAQEIINANYWLPKNVIVAADKFDLTVFTFGTVMEKIKTLNNNYIKSKRKLARFVDHRLDKGQKICHIRLHTLYGLGKPKSFMFLGKIFLAIKENKEFKMTNGLQLREYHHFNDVAKVIRSLHESNTYGIVNISTGKPIQLKTLAESIFYYFGLEKNLRIGALETNPNENFDCEFDKVTYIKDIDFRDSFDGVCEYLSKQINIKK
jgi:nucleoside-diphosphate-sugar epimerase